MPAVPAKEEARAEAKLTRSIDELRKTIEHLPGEYGYLLQPSRHLFFSYLRGIVAGLGAITAVAIVIPVMLWILHGIQWVPLLGDFVAGIATHVEQAQKTR